MRFKHFYVITTGTLHGNEILSYCIHCIIVRKGPSSISLKHLLDEQVFFVRSLFLTHEIMNEHSDGP